LAFPKLTQRYEPKPPASLADYLQAQAQVGRDMNIHGYVARGWVAWLSWAVDGLLVLAAALAMVVPAVRMPYCSRCQTWYRVIRSGRIDARTAGRLVELAEVRPGGQPTSARYRLLNCHAGCGPTGFQLSWQESGGSTFSVQAWLDAECRDRVMKLLDEARGGTVDSKQ